MSDPTDDRLDIRLPPETVQMFRRWAQLALTHGFELGEEDGQAERLARFLTERGERPEGMRQREFSVLVAVMLAWGEELVQQYSN